MKHLLIGLIFISFLSGPRIFAKDRPYRVNSAHSEVVFEIDYLEVGAVRGKIGDVRGDFRFDSQAGQLKSIEVEIRIDSISTGQKQRDRHLLTKDFFFASAYPLITFSSQKIKKISEKNWAVEGLINIKGIDVPQMFNVKWKGTKTVDGVLGQYFSLSAKVSRKSWGLNWNKLSESGDVILGDSVKLSGEIEAFVQGKRPQFSRFFRQTLEEKKRFANKKSKSASHSIPHDQVAMVMRDLEKKLERQERELSLIRKGLKVEDSQEKQTSLWTYFIYFFTTFVLFLSLFSNFIWWRANINPYLEKYISSSSGLFLVYEGFPVFVLGLYSYFVYHCLSFLF